MTTTSHSYPAYTPSGVPWLGDVPVHWEVVQLGRSGIFFKGSGGTKDDEVPDGIPCVRYGDLYTTHKSFISQTRSYVPPAKARAYTPINRGDVLFPTSGETIEEIGKSAVNLIHTQVLCGGDLIIFRPTIPMEPKFAGYALDCPAAQTQKSLMGRGITIMHIYSSQLKYLWLSLPPLPEQAAIVRYLDYVDRRIRRYVAAKRKLIALLEEEKQAVVNRAVTCGLNPNVRLKPSGVEWLGDVPAHWEMVRNGQLFVQRNEKGFPELPILEISLRTGINIRDFENSDRKQVMAVRGDYKRAVRGDIAYNMMRMWQGAIGVVPVDGLVSPAYVVAKPLRGNEPRYFSALFRTSGYMAEVDKYSRGIVKDRNRLYWEDFKQMPTPCPPPHEQLLIADAVDRCMATLNDGANRIRRQIKLLEEYRTRLIADVVTGKLDVREAAAQLPDETDDQDPIEESGPLADGMDEALYDIDESAEELAIESEVSA